MYKDKTQYYLEFVTNRYAGNFAEQFIYFATNNGYPVRMNLEYLEARENIIEVDLVEQYDDNGLGYSIVEDAKFSIQLTEKPSEELLNYFKIKTKEFETNQNLILFNLVPSDIKFVNIRYIEEERHQISRSIMFDKELKED